MPARSARCIRARWGRRLVNRSDSVIGHAVDVWGGGWYVSEQRITSHGWPVLLGWPDDVERGRGGQGAAVVLTQPLAQYLTEKRPRDLDLPIGRTVIKRLRRDLGLRWDWDVWWSDRADDLRCMTLEAFAARHGCSVGAASQRRAALGLHHQSRIGSAFSSCHIEAK